MSILDTLQTQHSELAELRIYKFHGEMPKELVKYQKNIGRSQNCLHHIIDDNYDRRMTSQLLGLVRLNEQNIAFNLIIGTANSPTTRTIPDC